MRENSKKVLVVYWSSRNLGVLDNIINSLEDAGFKIKEMQFNYLQQFSINKILHIRSNTNILNLLYLLILGLKLNLTILLYKRVYLFGSNLPLFCPFFINKGKLVCHYNEVPKFFDNSNSVVLKYEKAIFKNALNIVVSNALRQQLFETINKKATYYILDNILAFKYYEHDEYSFKKVNIPIKLLYSGIISKNREIVRIVRAIKSNDKFVLTLIGEIENSYSKIFLDEIQGNENIIYLGKVPFEMALKLTKETDFGIAIYNLKDKNNLLCAPVKIHEYFHFRKPVISLENPPLLHIAEEFQIVFPLKEIEELQKSKTAETLLDSKINSINFEKFEESSLKEFNLTINNLLQTVMK